MFKRTKINSCTLLALGGALLVPVSTVYAQAADSQRIEVTGSRIKSLNADSQSPVQVLTAEDIAASGVTNVQELLLKNPTMGTPLISRTNSNFQTSSVGVATVDLRNLGTARTLVLINGRRVVSGLPGDSAVDLNTIPTAFVERIEMLTGGASSLYGSDAVAGVVNIILKKNFEGVAVDVQGGASEYKDDTKGIASVTFGATSANGRSTLMTHLAFTEQGAVYSRDRMESAIDQTSVGARPPRNPARLFEPRRPFFSGFAPQGYFFTDTLAQTFDAQGNLIPQNTNGAGGAAPTGFNRSEFRTIAVPTKRFLFSSKGEHAIDDRHSVFIEGTYAASKTKSRLEPFPLASDDIYPVSGQVPAASFVNGVVVRNPLVPLALYNDMSDNDGDGLPDYFFTRRMAEVGTRGNVAERDMFRFVTGLKGDLGKSWTYDLFVGYGLSKEAQVSSGQVNVLNFRNALEAQPDVDDIDGDLNVTEAICRDANARAQGCVPINVFGFNSVSPAALAYVTAPGSLSTSTTQKLVGFTVTGDAFQLPAGPVGVALGGEYRKEHARSEFDALQQAGLNAGNAIPRTEGGFSVRELFAEARIPLLKNAPLAKSLSAILAIRGGDYSTVGNTTSWNAGIDWGVNSDVRVRATTALSTRAPNINELFSPPSQTFPTGLADPCDGITAATLGVVAVNCRANPGVAANIAANGTFTLTQADLQGISGFDAGNPNLKAEDGKSVTMGLVFTPTSIPALRNFVFSADYFKIKIDGAIVQTPRQFILDQCYGGNAAMCQFITRRAAAAGPNNAGSISFLNAGVTNSGGLETEGIDFAITHADKVGPGRLSTKLSWTYLKGGSVTPLPGEAPDPFAGEVGAAKQRGSLTLRYDWNNFGITSQTTYIGKSAIDDQFLQSTFGLAPGAINVGAKVYNDFQVTYNATKRTQFYFGIDNAFGTKAPPLISGLPENVTGTETDAGTYDAIGRKFYLGARLTF